MRKDPYSKAHVLKQKQSGVKACCGQFLARNLAIAQCFTAAKRTCANSMMPATFRFISEKFVVILQGSETKICTL